MTVAMPVADSSSAIGALYTSCVNQAFELGATRQWQLSDWATPSRFTSRIRRAAYPFDFASEIYARFGPDTEVVGDSSESAPPAGGTSQQDCHPLAVIAVGRPDPVYSELFQALASAWVNETIVAPLSDKVGHPAYKQIIDMGSAALPLILSEMMIRPNHWLVALHAIAGVDPAPRGSDFDAAREAWIRWGHSRGLI